jgi:hypothetical protein
MEFNNKLKPQGVRSNTKGVQEKIRQHILQQFSNPSDYSGNPATPVEALKNSVAAAADPRQPEKAAEAFIEGGAFEVSNDQVTDFINSLGLRQTKPEYSNDETWNLYTSLLSREIRNLINNPKLAEKLLKPIVPAAKPEGK